jgi:antirestriction protein
MSAATTDVTPALYCGTYAKYNDGSIEGKWLNLRDYADAQAFMQACRDLHHDEADPELMFQDFEGMPRELYSESLSLADLERIYKWINLDDDGRQLLAEYVDATGCAITEASIEDVQESLFCTLDYSNGADDNTAMGEYMIDTGLIEVPDHMQAYIDVAALGRDWLMDLSVSTNGYVFEV